MKRVIKELYPYVIIIIIVVLIRSFIATPVRVNGASMETTLYDLDILILNKMNKDYKRFDIVVINKKVAGEKTKLVKRVIGMPGESIEYRDNKLYIDGKEIEDVSTSRTSNFSLNELYGVSTIPDGYYFVMGDNRSNSLDSRDSRVGLIEENEILGTASIRLLPFSRMGKVK